MFKRILSFILLGVVLFCPVNTVGAVHIPIMAELDFQKKKYELVFNINNKHPSKIQLEQSSDNHYHIKLNIDHLKTSLFTISTVLESTIELHPMNQNGIRPLAGKIWSDYTLVNNKPADEFTGNFEIRDNYLYVDSITMGSISCKGSIQVIEPYAIDLNVYFTGIDLYEFITFFAGPKNIVAIGVVSGNIHISGTPNRIVLKGNPSTLDGMINKLKFNSIVLNSEGVYPNLDISGTTITKSDGVPLNIKGSIDLSDKKNLLKQIQSLTIEPTVSDDGNQREWTLKRFESEDRVGKTEFKYYLRKEDELYNGRGEQSADLLGVERRMEF